MALNSNCRAYEFQANECTSFWSESLGILPELFCLLTNWMTFLYGQIQSPCSDVIPDWGPTNLYLLLQKWQSVDYFLTKIFGKLFFSCFLKIFEWLSKCFRNLKIKKSWKHVFWKFFNFPQRFSANVLKIPDKFFSESRFWILIFGTFLEEEQVEQIDRKQNADSISN